MIDTLFHVAWLFVQQEAIEVPDWGLRAQEVFKGWKNTDEVFPVRTLGYILAGVLLVLAVIGIKQWYQNRPKDPSSATIFRRLASELHLSLRDQWLLIRIARHQELPSAITLLLCRQTFQRCAQAYVAHLAEMRQPGMTQTADDLMGRLFGSQTHAQADLLAVLASASFKLPGEEELADAGVGVENVTQATAEGLAEASAAQPASAGA